MIQASKKSSGVVLRYGDQAEDTARKLKDAQAKALDAQLTVARIQLYLDSGAWRNEGSDGLYRILEESSRGVH